MKISLLNIAILGMLSFAAYTALAQQNRKVEKARKEVAVAKENLSEAKIDSAADYQRFKKQAENQIMENQKKIAALRMRRSNDTKEIKMRYDKKLLELDQKNNVLKRNIKNTETIKTDNWQSFKAGFNKIMADLDRDIASIASDSTN